MNFTNHINKGLCLQIVVGYTKGNRPIYSYIRDHKLHTYIRLRNALAGMKKKLATS